jgi:WD repeat-containing protein 19
VLNYLARLPSIYASYGTRMAYLSSLREVSVADGGGERASDVVPVALEPAFLALGPQHLAVGINNHVMFYRVKDRAQVNEQEYLGKVLELRLNDRFAAVLSEDQIMLHAIEPGPRTAGQPNKKTFPGDLRR